MSKHFIVTERQNVADAIRMVASAKIAPEFAEAPVLGRVDQPTLIASLQKGDIVVGNVDVPTLTAITAADATFYGWGVSAPHSKLKEENPSAERLVSEEFRGRIQRLVAIRHDDAKLPDSVLVHSNQLLAQICELLSEQGVAIEFAGEVHPSQAEKIEKLRRGGMRVVGAVKYGVGRVGRNWKGKTVVGHQMPRHATEYCTAGAAYFHLVFDRPVGAHNHDWSMYELHQMNARFVQFEVWRWGKSIRLFDSSDADLNV